MYGCVCRYRCAYELSCINYLSLSITLSLLSSSPFETLACATVALLGLLHYTTLVSALGFSMSSLCEWWCLAVALPREWWLHKWLPARVRNSARIDTFACGISPQRRRKYARHYGKLLLLLVVVASQVYIPWSIAPEGPTLPNSPHLTEMNWANISPQFRLVSVLKHLLSFTLCLVVSLAFSFFVSLVFSCCMCVFFSLFLLPSSFFN
jgi:hypothetical protein